ncbi:MAG TPA: NTPase [Candidatus Krumholzibacteriaceae bacterium]|jgi:nucleoside-triphosphatase|nr:NTPase [Candidatus Krumholzibacteriaceae bacterium]
MQKQITLITGVHGTGKTTVITRVADAFRAKGYKIGGMTSKERREGEARVGFLIQDVSTGEQGWLAHVNQQDGPRIGKYRVNLGDLENIGAKAIHEATETADVIIIDEIGPMELHSQAFTKAVQEAMDSGKPVVATIHYKATDVLVRSIKARPDAELTEVTLQNRADLHNLIIEKIATILQGG